MDVHRTLGPGLLESAYQVCLCHELHLRDIDFVQQVELPVNYKGVRLECGYRIDLIVCQRVVVGLKSVQDVLPVHEAQLLTYMCLTGIHVGLLINSTSLFGRAASDAGFYNVNSSVSLCLCGK